MSDGGVGLKGVVGRAWLEETFSNVRVRDKPSKIGGQDEGTRGRREYFYERRGRTRAPRRQRRVLREHIEIRLTET